MLKKFLLLVVAGLASMGAMSAGWFDFASKSYVSGWACNPATPGYSGDVHFWRDDGVFLGAVPAKSQREPAVGSVCGDSGVHGFSGALNYPAAYLDDQHHTVRGYFIGMSGTGNLELQNAMDVVFDGAIQPQTMQIFYCGQGQPSSDWMLVKREVSGICSSRWVDENRIERVYGYLETWAYVPDMPVGYATTTCKPPYPIFMNFQLLSEIQQHFYCIGTGYRVRRIQ